MKVSELIEKLQDYPQGVQVGLVNLSDDTGNSDELLSESSIDVVELHNEDGNPIGKGVAICHSKGE